MSLPISFDHCVIHVAEWERSNAFYAQVFGAEIVTVGKGFAYRFGSVQLNCHGPGAIGQPRARIPVEPGNSDLCFEWHGPIAGAIAHLAKLGVSIEIGPVERRGAKNTGSSVYFRDPDGSLMEFISYSP